MAPLALFLFIEVLRKFWGCIAEGRHGLLGGFARDFLVCAMLLGLLKMAKATIRLKTRDKILMPN